jgi:hypothetical protein
MKRIVALVFICSFASIALAQRYNMEVGFRVGMANYVGDIGGKEKAAQPWLLDLKWQKTRVSLGAFFRHRIHPQVAYNLGLTYVRIEGDDKLSTNPGRVGRNLNFSNNLFNIHGRIEWFPNFLRKADCGFNTQYRTAFETYLFAGVEAIIHSPKTELNGTNYTLRNYQTEGVKYSPVAFGIPMGLGFQFVFARKHRLGLEIQWSWTATDYLDDISGNYVAHTDPTAAALANRRPELGETAGVPHEANYTPGSLRGDITDRDSYFMITLNYSIAFKTKSLMRTKYSWVYGGAKKFKKTRAKL